jgi:hypothetical protein
MSITAKNTGNNFEVTPSGNHIARCYSMVEIGTVKEEFKGEVKNLHKVRITWELPLEKRVFNPDKGEQPFSISKEYTLSMHEKAVLRKDLSSWRGKPFSEDEAKSFDITKLLGIACMINVVHIVSSKSGNTYANVAAITPMPKGVSCPPQINETFEFSYADFEDTKFAALPEYLRKKMEVTPEYLNSKGMPLAGYESAPPQIVADETDDLPF